MEKSHGGGESFAPGSERVFNHETANGKVTVVITALPVMESTEAMVNCRVSVNDTPVQGVDLETLVIVEKSVQQLATEQQKPLMIYTTPGDFADEDALVHAEYILYMPGYDSTRRVNRYYKTIQRKRLG